MQLEEQISMIEQDDWRLHVGNKPELYASLTWSFKKWTQTRPHWNHDHCEFCQIKLSDSEIDEVMHEGWTDNDEYHWICVTCFNDFRDLYRWKVK